MVHYIIFLLLLFFFFFFATFLIPVLLNWQHRERSCYYAWAQQSVHCAVALAGPALWARRHSEWKSEKTEVRWQVPNNSLITSPLSVHWQCATFTTVRLHTSQSAGRHIHCLQSLGTKPRYIHGIGFKPRVGSWT